MALNFDFLKGDSLGGNEFMVPNTFGDKMSTVGSTVDNSAVGDFFKDPNNLRLLAEMGSRFGQGQGAGQAIGDATQSLIRRKQLQEAVGAQQSQEGDMRKNLLKALTEGRLLSPTDQNDAFDNVTIDGDGNINLKLKNTPAQTKKSLTDLPLEASKGMNTSAKTQDGEFDLSPFF